MPAVKMMNNSNYDFSSEWQQLVLTTLRTGKNIEKSLALDFLSNQSSFPLELCQIIFPLVKDNVLNPDTQVRYYARKARNHLLECFPELAPEKAAPKLQPLKLDEGKPITAEQILLHKLRLGSRYVVFEALERLTESGDANIFEPLRDFLKEETDEFKISFAIKSLSRIQDSRIPDLLDEYLDHEDPRVVANALEGLCNYDSPENEDRFIEFSSSNDNRIRANAVQGLYKYQPHLAEKHISEMINSKNIALQASGVYLLKVVRPSNLADLLEIAHQSRFASVRMNALDIAPPSPEESEINKLKAREEIEIPNPRRDFFLMAAFIMVGAFMLLLTEARYKNLLSVTFLGFAATIMATHEKTRTSFQKMALSMGFVSSMAWGSTRLLILPALMGLWLTWNGNQINKAGKLEKPRPGSIFAWFFALGAIIITQLIQNDHLLAMGLAQRIAGSTRAQPAIIDAVTRHNNFELIIFVMVSVMTLAIMKLNEWFPPRYDQNPSKRLVIATVVCLAAILLINVSHLFGMSLHLKVNGLGDSFHMLKQLLP